MILFVTFLSSFTGQISSTSNFWILFCHFLPNSLCVCSNEHTSRGVYSPVKCGTRWLQATGGCSALFQRDPAKVSGYRISVNPTISPPQDIIAGSFRVEAGKVHRGWAKTSLQRTVDFINAVGFSDRHKHCKPKRIKGGLSILSLSGLLSSCGKCCWTSKN